MDKSRLVENFARLVAREQFGFDGIRVYLYLLAACDASGKGTITSADLQQALGHGFSPGMLRAACRALSDRKLIAILAQEKNSPDSVIGYRLLPIRRETS